MHDPVFDGLMIHWTTIVQGSRKVSSTANYGHTEPTKAGGGRFTTIENTYMHKVSLMRPLSVDEIDSLSRAGTVLYSHKLYLPAWAMPETLKPYGASTRHQVWSVYRKGTTILIDPGPFDIVDIQQPTGHDHHWTLSLKRAA